MQAKGLVKFFGIALVAVCLYQLSFTFLTNRVEGQAKQYAADKVAQLTNLSEEDQAEQLHKERRAYLESVGTEPIVLGFTYNDVKERQLNLGLDLQGGMSVVLQVSLEELIRAMANDSQDPTFDQAMKNAKEAQKNAQADLVTLFGQEFQKLDANASLAAIFASADQSDISFQSSNDEVLTVIKKEADDAVDRTFQILRTRIDQFGVTQPNIALQPATGRIVVELPGVDDPERVRKLLQTTAKLEFWEVAENSRELQQALNAANEALKDKLGIEDEEPEKETDSDTAANDSTQVAANDSTDKEEEVSLLDNSEESDTTALTADEFGKKNPFFKVFSPNPNGGSPIIGYVAGKDTSKFNEYLKMPEVIAELPANIKLLYDAKPLPPEDLNEDSPASLYTVYAIESRYGSEFIAPLEGDVITDAVQDVDYNQQVVVSMTMNPEGANQWSKLTAANLQESVAIVLDNKVYSAPTVQSQISGGRSQITGNFTMGEAMDLANILKAGKLPAPARIVEEAVVGPSLGQQSIRNGLASLLAGILLVLGFMIVYYSTGGVVAIIALLANLFFVIGVLASLGATLTLPGMAGIVLTIGMAVDANVIIFERIREELERGSGLRKAIADGYSKSYSAIIDANLTTLITAAILYYFGLGPVLGFATVLIIGIFSSLFTAILITRLIIDWYIGQGKELKYYTSWTKGAFKNLNIDFISRRKLSYVVSGIILTIGLVSILSRGFELGVDFKGGYTYVVQFDDAVSTTDVRDALTAPLQAAPLVRTYGASNQVKITTSYLIDSDAKEANDQVTRAVYTGLGNFLNGKQYEAFTAQNIQSSQKVGPTIADDIKSGAVKATLFALIGIFLYILARFRRWQFGMAAVLTVCHDTLFLLSVFSIGAGFLPFSMEIDQQFIAAILTVIGYSINDTVVVFDRIREYLQLYPKRDQKIVINDAINSTLSRTIITSLTTLIVVVILFIVGGEVIRGFSFALLLGIFVGTYSSIFVATPLVVDLSEQYNKRMATANAADKKGKGKRKKRKRQNV